MNPFLATLAKDARRELRSKEGLQAGIVLVGLFFVLYLFAFTDLQGHRLATLALWTPLVYGSAALAGHSLATEADRGTLDILRAMPVPVAWHGISRTLLTLGLLVLLTAFTYAVAIVGFRMPSATGLLPVLALAAIGLSIIGTLAGGLAAQARGRGILMPILVIPLAAPLLQSGVQATQDALAGQVDTTPLLIMAGYDLIVAGLAWILWPFVLEAD